MLPVAGTLGVYGHSIGNGFVWDGEQIIVENRETWNLSAISRALRPCFSCRECREEILRLGRRFRPNCVRGAVKRPSPDVQSPRPQDLRSLGPCRRGGEQAAEQRNQDRHRHHRLLRARGLCAWARPRFALFDRPPRGSRAWM